jgi:hypothetical protein
MPQLCLINFTFSSVNSASTATPHSRLGSSGFEPLDHILTWPSLNSQSSQKLLRLICCSSGLLRPCQNVSYALTLCGKKERQDRLKIYHLLKIIQSRPNTPGILAGLKIAAFEKRLINIAYY